MMTRNLEQLTSEVRRHHDIKADYAQVQTKSKLFLEEFDQSFSKEKRLFSEINDLFSASADRHFFQEQQQRHFKDSRQVLNQIEETTHDLKRQTSKLLAQIEELESERDQLEKSDR